MDARNSLLFEDFHGYSVPQAKVALARIFRKATEQSSVSIYIVTGRGSHVNANGARGVLRKILPDLLVPYACFIDRTEEEPSAYKIILKRQAVHPAEKFLDGFFRQLEASPLRTPMLCDLRETEKKAQTGNVEALLQIAETYVCGLFPEFRDVQKGIDYYLDAVDLGSLEAAGRLGQVYVYGLSNCKSDAKKAEKYLWLAASKGDAEAQFQLGSFYLMGQAGYTDGQKGRRWIQAAADQNHVPAMHTLSDSYMRGDFTEQSFEKAVHYLKICASQGFAVSQTSLARCYAAGQGVEKDLHMAYSLYKKAAASNVIFALFQLGEYHSDDRVGLKDSKKAFGYYMKAAQLGDSDAMYRVGQAYFTGSGVDKDKKEGMAWLQKGVDQQNPHAAFTLAFASGGTNRVEWFKLLCNAATWGSEQALDLIAGLLFEGSQDVPNDLIFACLLKLAKSKNGKAQSMLAHAYFDGKGTPINDVEGMTWLLASVSLENPEGCYMLACRYRKESKEPVRQLWLWYMRVAADRGVSDAQMAVALAFFRGDEDLGLAHIYFSKAAQQGVTAAKMVVGLAYMNGGDGIQKDERLGAKWLREAADEGDVKAQYNIAVALSNGYGVNVDKPAAFEYYLKAAHQNFLLAQSAVISCYLHGEGVRKSANEALRWVEILANRGDPRACFMMAKYYFKKAEALEDTEDVSELIHYGMEYLQTSAEAGSLPALYTFGGILVASGQTVEGNALQQAAIDQGYDPEEAEPALSV